MKIKQCKVCHSVGHTSFNCFKNKRSSRLNNRHYLRKIGKQGQRWLEVRAEWFKQNPAQWYYCYIDNEQLSPKETTLDHIQSRARHPELRYDLANLAPCCYFHNMDKGSLSLEEYLAKLKNLI